MHTLESFVTPTLTEPNQEINLNKNKFLEFVKRTRSSFLNSTLKYSETTFSQDVVFDLEPKGKVCLLKERQQGVTTSLLYYCLKLTQTNKNYQISFVSWNYNAAKRAMEIFREMLYFFNINNRTSGIKDSIVFENGSRIEFSSHKESVLKNGCFFDLVVGDESDFNTQDRFTYYGSLNIIITKTIFDYNQVNKYVFKEIFGKDDVNNNILPIYLDLLPELTKNSQYKVISLIQDPYGRFKNPS